jgi:hypothetical protein
MVSRRNLIGQDAEHRYGDDFKAEADKSHDVRRVIPAITTNTNQQTHARKGQSREQQADVSTKYYIRNRNSMLQVGCGIAHCATLSRSDESLS